MDNPFFILKSNLTRLQNFSGQSVYERLAKKLSLVLKKLFFGINRITCILVLGAALFTFAGGGLLLPLCSYYFLGTWRFWRHTNLILPLYRHGWKMFRLIFKGDNGGYMFSASIFSAPRSTPDLSLINLAPSWPLKIDEGCGTCTRCCTGCPLHDAEQKICVGYNQFYWRYFNCGRYPYTQAQIDFYGCPKWKMASSAKQSTK